MAHPLLIVTTTLPDADSAHVLARDLVEARLAACVQVGAAVASCYHWEGTLETATEIPLLIKTSADRYAALETFLRERHPYKLPEIVAVPATHGSPAYLDWVYRETRA